MLASNHPTHQTQGQAATTLTTPQHIQGLKSSSGLYGTLKLNPSKQNPDISQCQNIAKMLASQNKIQRANQRATPTSNQGVHSSKRLADARNVTMKRSNNLKTQRAAQGKKKGVHIRSPGQDHFYVDRLLATVDKAITTEYGQIDTNQTLTFDEIFNALRDVHKKYDHKRRGSGRSSCTHVHAPPSRHKCTTGGPGGDSGEELRRQDSPETLVSSSSFWCAFEATPVVTAGGSVGGATEEDVELLLSKSEEMLLLRELEMDARKMSLNSLSYLQCGGETVSSCLATKQLG